ncbi:MAG TPA: hypothetical protein VNL17_16460 [Verrucomicrobiae bacterium]|nr:hypothetical protein [Verrucomicrobiae bacterium]
MIHPKPGRNFLGNELARALDLAPASLLACQKVLASSLLAEAKTEPEKQIQEIASKDDYSAEFEYAPAAAFTRGN